MRRRLSSSTSQRGRSAAFPAAARGGGRTRFRAREPGGRRDAMARLLDFTRATSPRLAPGVKRGRERRGLPRWRALARGQHPCRRGCPPARHDYFFVLNFARFKTGFRAGAADGHARGRASASGTTSSGFYDSGPARRSGCGFFDATRIRPMSGFGSGSRTSRFTSRRRQRVAGHDRRGPLQAPPPPARSAASGISRSLPRRRMVRLRYASRWRQPTERSRERGRLGVGVERLWVGNCRAEVPRILLRLVHRVGGRLDRVRRCGSPNKEALGHGGDPAGGVVRARGRREAVEWARAAAAVWPDAGRRRRRRWPARRGPNRRRPGRGRGATPGALSAAWRRGARLLQDPFVASP